MGGPVRLVCLVTHMGRGKAGSKGLRGPERAASRQKDAPTPVTQKPAAAPVAQALRDRDNRGMKPLLQAIAFVLRIVIVRALRPKTIFTPLATASLLLCGGAVITSWWQEP